MIQVKELMVGDWVLDGGTPRRVIQLTDDLCDSNAPGIILENGAEYEYAVPIPLTAEILERNSTGGYGRYAEDSSTATYHLRDNDYSEDCVIYAEWNRREPYIEIGGLGDTFFKGSITSVHELQHALRLCGLNELADNFQV